MVCDKEKCTGCFACYNICPKHAINMVEDNNGFIYPEIDKSKCINCGLCKKVCPSLSGIELNNPIKCFAFQRNNKHDLIKSTSGGAASLLSEIFLDNKGIVYSAVFSSTFKINHVRIDNKKKLNNMRGSKYVHSYINDTYSQAKKDLLNNRNVLFIGTPCQIAGLKNYLMKEYDNLYTVDLICHGVPSQLYLKKALSKNCNLDEVKNIKFRNNNLYEISINDGITISNYNSSLYLNGFMNGFILRENCYSCLYSNKKRCSDITVGDFWGLDKSSKLYDNKNLGVSEILLNTKKGVSLFENIKYNSNYEERNITEAVKGNSQLRHPVLKPKKYYKFKSDFSKYGFDKAFKKNYRLFYFKLKLKNNTLLYSLYKTIRRG